MQAQNCLLQISNLEIGFLYQENKILQSKISIKNISTKNVAFKIKSTNPNCFNVKPNKGDLFPDEEIQINFKMQPQNLNFQILTSIVFKERFLMQAIEIEPNMTVQQIQYFWTQKRQEEIVSTKLSTYLFTEDQDGKQNIIQNSLKKSSEQGLFQSMGGQQFRSMAATKIDPNADPNTVLHQLSKQYSSLNSKIMNMYLQRQEVSEQLFQIKNESSSTKGGKLLQLILAVLFGFLFEFYVVNLKGFIY